LSHAAWFDAGSAPVAARAGPRSPGRVLVVAPQPFYEDRGTPIAVRQAIEALTTLRYDVDLLTYPVGRDIQLPGVRIFRVANPLHFDRVPIGMSVRKIVLDALLVPALRNRLGSERYVAVHAVEEAAFPAIWLCRRYGIPVVYDMQSSLPEQLAQDAFFRFPPVHAAALAAERWLLTRAALVVSSTGLAPRVRTAAPGAQSREWRFHGQTPTSSPVVGATSPRTELGIPDSARVILYAGSFAGYQGLENLVSAIPSVTARVPQATFVLLGGTGSGELRGDARRLQTEGTLHVLPRLSRDEIPRYYATADILVSPRSYGNNAPLKIFDYLCAGRPIVATDIPAHRALLAEGRALLVEARPEALADALVRVLQDPRLAADLSRNAQAYADEHLGWDGFVKVVAEWYDHVLRTVPAAGR
jgi:glycosyltransferase involved in cell wall biosynthesis